MSINIALDAETVFITNSFQGAKRDVLSVDEHLYDQIVMLGIDKNLTDSIKIELTAAVDEHFVETCFNVDKLTSFCVENAVNYLINASPTAYLCNTAYYHMLNKKQNTIFIHIPSIGRMNSDFMKLLIDLFRNWNIVFSKQYPDVNPNSERIFFLYILRILIFILQSTYRTGKCYKKSPLHKKKGDFFIRKMHKKTHLLFLNFCFRKSILFLEKCEKKPYNAKHTRYHKKY